MDTKPTPFLDAHVTVKNGPLVEGAEKVYRKAWAAVGYFEEALTSAHDSVARLSTKRDRQAEQLAETDACLDAAYTEVEAVTEQLNAARRALALALQET